MERNYSLKTKLNFESKSKEEDLITITVSVGSNHAIGDQTIRALEEHFLKQDVMIGYDKVDMKRGRVVKKDD